MSMSRSDDYIGNTRLEDLAENTGFSLYLFDDEAFNVNLKDETSGGEVDAILQYKNIFSIVEVYSGRDRDTAERKIKTFKRNFRNFNNAQHINNLIIKNTGTSRVAINAKRNAAQNLTIIKNSIGHLTANNLKINVLKLFFAPEVDITEETEDSYRSENIIILDKEVFFYFRKVYKILGNSFLLRDFLSFLDVRKIDLERASTTVGDVPEQTRPYDTIRLSIKDGEMIMYSTLIPVSKMSEYVTVFRIGQKRYNAKGFQRMLKEDRLKNIAKEYLAKNETFPNNIIIGLDPEIYRLESDFYDSHRKRIKFYKEFNSLLIIDGQHRFFSFIKSEKIENEILVNFIHFPGGVSAIKKLYEMFYEINSKQKGIDPNLSFVLKALINPESENAFWFKVFQKLNRDGFFKNKVSFKERELRYGDEEGIISVIKYGGLLNLNKDKPFGRTKIDGLKRLYGSRNEVSQIIFAVKLFNNYFNLIEEILHNQGKTKDYLTPREIGALIRLIRHFLFGKQKQLKILGTISSFSKRESLSKKAVSYIRNILKCIDFKAVNKASLGSSNWGAVEGLMLRQIVKDKKCSFGNKDLLTKKGLSIFNSP